MKCLFFSLLMTSLGVALPVLAVEETVSLESLLREALRESPSIEKAEAVADEYKWKHSESYQGFLPSLTGGITYLTNERYALVDANFGSGPISIAQVIPTTQYNLNLSWLLFDGFATTYRFNATDAQSEAAKSDYEWSKFVTRRQVELQFFKALAAEALKEVAEQNLATLKDHLKDAEATRKAGIGTNFDLLRVEVQVSEAKSEVMNAQDNCEIAKFKLGEVLGKEVEVRKLSGAFPKISKFKLVEYKDSHLRKDLQALNQRASSLNDLAVASQRYWVPRVSAFGNYQYYNNRNDRFTDTENFREAYQIGLNLTWNIFDGFGPSSKSHQSAAQALQLEKTVQMARLKARQDAEIWRRKFDYFKSFYEARTVDIQKSTEAVRLAREGRRAGARTNAELLDAELDLFRTRAGLVNAQIGAMDALINFELSTGQTVFEIKE